MWYPLQWIALGIFICRLNASVSISVGIQNYNHVDIYYKTWHYPQSDWARRIPLLAREPRVLGPPILKPVPNPLMIYTKTVPNISKKSK
jgi:hypothetical protein